MIPNRDFHIAFDDMMTNDMVRMDIDICAFRIKLIALKRSQLTKVMNVMVVSLRVTGPSSKCSNVEDEIPGDSSQDQELTH